MTKGIREIVRLKYNNRCAYTGRPLGDKWQIDHITPQYKFDNNFVPGDKNHIDNLLPTISIINHYKRGQDLELFRQYMMTLHLRLAKLPKKTSLEKTKKRIEYLNKVAELFDISVDKPFNGVFYFETITFE